MNLNNLPLKKVIIIYMLTNKDAVVDFEKFSYKNLTAVFKIDEISNLYSKINN